MGCVCGGWAAVGGGPITESMIFPRSRARECTSFSRPALRSRARQISGPCNFKETPIESARAVPIMYVIYGFRATLPQAARGPSNHHCVRLRKYGAPLSADRADEVQRPLLQSDTARMYFRRIPVYRVASALFYEVKRVGNLRIGSLHSARSGSSDTVTGFIRSQDRPEHVPAGCIRMIEQRYPDAMSADR